MDAVRTWALSICIAAIAGSLIQLVSPNGAAQRALKISVSLFFLCIMLTPVLTGALNGELRWDIQSAPAEFQTRELQDAYEKQIAEGFTSSIEQLVREELQKIGVQAQEILVGIHTQEDGGISITEVVLRLDQDEENKQAVIIRHIQEALGISPQIQLG